MLHYLKKDAEKEGSARYSKAILDLYLELALQLLCWEMSESMGNHDSNVVGRVC
jgi:hypothetical protein